MKRPDPDKPIICIVDDDPSVLKALSRLVESAGMCAEPFKTAEEFLTSAPAAKAACLLLDVQLPSMDGFELQERAAQLGYDVPAIFITARPDQTSRTKARSAGAVAFLEKPVDEAALFDAIELALSRWIDGDGPPARLDR